MEDLFNNCDIDIINASQTKEGLVPNGDKKGKVVIKPKEDNWIMTSKLDGGNIVHTKESIFQATTEDEFPLEMGIGIIEDNKLTPIMSVFRENASMYWFVDIYGEKLNGFIPSNETIVNKINTWSILYNKGHYDIVISGVHKYRVPEHVELTNVPPVFFIEFNTPLKSAFLASNLQKGCLKNKKCKKMYEITSKPNFFIKDLNE